MTTDDNTRPAEAASRPTRRARRSRVAKTPRCRPFSLLDGMVLIIAAAAMLTLTRLPFVRKSTVLDEIRGLFLEQDSPIGWGEMTFDERMVLLTGCLMIGTLATLILRLRRPRPDLSRLFRQPGACSCAAAMLVMAVYTCWLVAVAIAEPWEIELWWQTAVYPIPAAAGAAVAGAWLSRRMGGGVRSERGWIDRQGRMVGICWILMAMLVCWKAVQHQRADLKRHIVNRARSHRMGNLPPLTSRSGVSTPTIDSDPIPLFVGESIELPPVFPDEPPPSDRGLSPRPHVTTRESGR